MKRTRRCAYCGKTVASAKQVEEEGADKICTGKIEFTTDPFMVDVHDDYGKLWICPGYAQNRRDDI